MMIPDFVRALIDSNMFFAVPIFANSRELHTKQDLARANAELCFLNGEQMARKRYIQAIGQRLLAEANDLKRPLGIIEQEMNFEDGLMEGLLNGDIELDLAAEILKRVNQMYPVSLNSLWVELDDSQDGIRVQKKADSEASARVLDRPEFSPGSAPALAAQKPASPGGAGTGVVQKS
jgi:hypothetical protein